MRNILSMFDKYPWFFVGIIAFNLAIVIVLFYFFKKHDCNKMKYPENHPVEDYEKNVYWEENKKPLWKTGVENNFQN
jgi:hypothetical protein